MGLTADGLSLLFTIKGKNEASPEVKQFREDVEKEVKAVKAATDNVFNDLAGSIGLSAKQTAGLSAALPVLGNVASIAAGAVVGMTAAVAGAGVAFFGLVKSASDYGSAIFDVTEKTGLGAVAVSALKLAADQGGSSLEQITGSLEKFAKLLGQAKDGSLEAQKTLKELGVTSSDLETAFGQFTKTVFDAKSGVEQITLAQKGAGKSGADLIGVIKQMNGDFAAFKQAAEEAGQTLSDADVAAADSFGDSLLSLTNQLKTTSTQVLLQFAPDIESGMKSISDSLAKNSKDIKKWGEDNRDVIRGVIRYFEEAQQAAEDFRNNSVPFFERADRYLFGDEAVDRNKKTNAFAFPTVAGNQLRENLRQKGVEETTLLPAPKPQAETFDPSLSGKAEEKEAEKRRKEREAIKKRDNAAQIDILKAHLANEQKIYQDAFDKLKEQFKQNGNADLFQSGLQNATAIFGNAANEIIPKLEKLEKAGAGLAQKTASEVQLLTEQQAKRIQDITDLSTKISTEKQNLVTENQKKQSEKQTKTAQEEIRNEIELRDKANATVQARLAASLAESLINKEKFLKANQLLEAQYIETDKKTDSKDNTNFTFYDANKDRNIALIEGRLKFRRDKLIEELAIVQKGSDEEARINQELAKLKIETEKEYYEQKKQTAEQSKDTAADNKKSLETERDLQAEILELRRLILRTEREIIDYRKEQERKSLENIADTARGGKRVDAIEKLKQFDLEAAQRRSDNRQLDLQDSLDIALKRIEGEKDEQEKKAQIIEEYRQKGLLSEIEYQEELKRIRQGYKSAELEARDNIDPFSAFAAGIGQYLENVALVRDANGQLQFSFETVFATMKDLGLQAFSSLTQGFGQMIGNWVLYGNLGGMTLRKLAAPVLSQLAATATSYALMCLAAAAFATTAFGAAILGGSPTQFLTAAAAFGAVAIGAAVGGRLLAGDSFSQKTAQQQTSGAYGSAGNGQSGGTRNGSPQPYSGQGNNIKEYNGAINQPTQIVRHEVNLKGEDYFFDIIENNVSKNGRFRQMITNLIDGI